MVVDPFGRRVESLELFLRSLISQLGRSLVVDWSYRSGKEIELLSCPVEPCQPNQENLISSSRWIAPIFSTHFGIPKEVMEELLPSRLNFELWHHALAIKKAVGAADSKMQDLKIQDTLARISRLVLRIRRF